MQIPRIDTVITIDGSLDEPVWRRAARLTGFSQYQPVDGLPAVEPTEVLTATLVGRKPRIPSTSVCIECKRRGIVCVMVAHGTPCLGPVTQAGCGALCPAYNRGCYGCFGPMETPNTGALVAAAARSSALSERDVERVFRTFNANAEPFRRRRPASG